MDAVQIEKLASALADAWENFTTIPLPPAAEAPSTRAEAYAVQDRMAQIYGGRCVGWKVGATSRAVQKFEGHDGPTVGRLFAPGIFTSPARVPASYAGYKLECEFGFRFRAAVPPRAAPYSRAEIAPLIVLHPGIELSASHYSPSPEGRKPTTLDGLADNGSSGCFVFGAAVEDWQGTPFETWPIAASIDGGPPIRFYTGDYRRDVADVVVETVNDLGRRGYGFAAGDWIGTGSLTVPTPIGLGQTARARIGELPEISVTIG